MTTRTYKHEVSVDNASKFREWIRSRGGVAVWRSVDLSDPGFSLSTPALTEDGKPYPKPHWKVDDKPAFTVTDAAEVCVYDVREADRFRVAVRRGGNGLSLKLTDASGRKLRAAVDRAGEGAFHVFDYERQEAVVLVPVDRGPLSGWEA